MTVLQFILGLRPALPLSQEKPGSKDKPCSVASNSEVKRWIDNGSVVINGERWKPEEEAPPMVWQLVFFPKSPKRATVI
jgi:hypothetical protein